MATGLRVDRVDHLDNFADDSPVHTPGDTLASTMQKCSAHIRSHCSDAHDTRADRTGELESDGVGKNHGNPGRSKGPDGTEEREERQMVQFNRHEQHPEDQPRSYDHRESPTGVRCVRVLPTSMFTTALPLER